MLARQLDGPYLNGFIAETTFFLGFQMNHVEVWRKCNSGVAPKGHDGIDQIADYRL